MQRPAVRAPQSVVSGSVLTTSRTSIVGPSIVEGQVQTYETIALGGNAC